MNLTLKQARALRAAMLEMSSGLSDKLASTVPLLFQNMKYDNSVIVGGTRINWNNSIKRAIADLHDLEENNPDNAPELWENV